MRILSALPPCRLDPSQLTTVAPIMDVKHTMGSVKKSRNGSESESRANSLRLGTAALPSSDRSSYCVSALMYATFWRNTEPGLDSRISNAIKVVTPIAIAAALKTHFLLPVSVKLEDASNGATTHQPMFEALR